MIFQSDFVFSLIKIVLITSGTLGMMFTLTTFRYRTQRILFISGLYLLWVTLSTAVILSLFGLDGMIRAFPITISVPAILIACKINLHSLAQSVFNYASQIVFSLILSVAVLLLNTILNGGRVTELLLRGFLYGAVIILEWHFLRRPFQRLTEVIQKGWGILSLLPFSFTLLLILLETVPSHYMDIPVHLLYIAGTILTLLIVYFVIFQSLIRQYNIQMLSHDKDVLQVQISSMNKQAAAIFAEEKKLRILRHDIRHFASVIKASLEEGSIEKALSALSVFEAANGDSASKTYCCDHLLNSLLSAYFEKADNSGIELQVKFTAPPADSVNTTEFSVMLANALENAINACEKGTSKQVISLKSRLYNGQYVLELSNTCDGVVLFDKEGLPVTQNGKGHGIGTRSILVFSKKYHAPVSFQLNNKHFIFRIMLSPDGKETIHKV